MGVRLPDDVFHQNGNSNMLDDFLFSILKVFSWECAFWLVLRDGLERFGLVAHMVETKIRKKAGNWKNGPLKNNWSRVVAVKRSPLYDFRPQLSSVFEK